MILIAGILFINSCGDEVQPSKEYFNGKFALDVYDLDSDKQSRDTLELKRKGDSLVWITNAETSTIYGHFTTKSFVAYNRTNPSYGTLIDINYSDYDNFQINYWFQNIQANDTSKIPIYIIGKRIY